MGYKKYLLRPLFCSLLLRIFRLFAIFVTQAERFYSVIWRNYVRQFGIIPFGKKAKFDFKI